MEIMERIKAIQTKYNGYTFRSRLEARWAVLFDSLKIRYNYEPEGFELNNGEWYLPDFYLPEINCYVEVKPWLDEKLSEYKKKLFEFSNSIHTPILLCTDLWTNWMPIFTSQSKSVGFATFAPTDFGFVLCTFFKGEYVKSNTKRIIDVKDYFKEHNKETCFFLHLLSKATSMDIAIANAKSARFEYEDF